MSHYQIIFLLLLLRGCELGHIIYLLIEFKALIPLASLDCPLTFLLGFVITHIINSSDLWALSQSRDLDWQEEGEPRKLCECAKAWSGHSLLLNWANWANRDRIAHMRGLLTLDFSHISRTSREYIRKRLILDMTLFLLDFNLLPSCHYCCYLLLLIMCCTCGESLIAQEWD